MKYSKRYIAFTVILALTFFMKFQIFGVDHAKIGEFRGGKLGAISFSYISACFSSGIRIMITSAAFVASATDITLSP